MHPAILDSCIHIGVHKMSTGCPDDNIYYLPSRVDSVIIHDLLKKGLPDTVFVHMQFRRWRPDDLTFDFTITDPNGAQLLTLRGFEVAKHRSNFDEGIPRRFDVVHEPIDGVAIPIPPPRAGKNAPLTVHFSRGNEMDIQAKLSSLDREMPETVWISATSGVNGAAARGFSRSLRREMISWDIRLVLFPMEWSSEMRLLSVSYLSKAEIGQQEMVVDKTGAISVPKFRESAPPQERLLNKNPRWQVLANKKLSYTVLPSVPEDSLLVEFETLSEDEGGLRGFVGQVVGGAHGGSKVVGVTDQPLSNFAIVHEGWVVPLPTTVSDIHRQLLPAFALGAVVAALALGTSAIAQPTRLKKSQVLIAGSNGPISPSVSYILSSLGVKHEITNGVTPDLVKKLAAYKFVVSGTRDKEEAQILRSALPSQLSLFLWNDSTSGIRSAINQHAWLVSDAITVLLGQFALTDSDADLRTLKAAAPKSYLDAIQVSGLDASQSLFDPGKTYLLIGGIGSLGVHVALWMYQVRCLSSVDDSRGLGPPFLQRGARQIVLTSRSGEES